MTGAMIRVAITDPCPLTLSVLADALEEEGLTDVAVAYGVGLVPVRYVFDAWLALRDEPDLVDHLMRGGSLAGRDTLREVAVWHYGAHLCRVESAPGDSPARSPAVRARSLACLLWDTAGRDGPHLLGRGAEMLGAASGGRMDPAEPWYGIAPQDFSRLRRWVTESA